MLSFGALGCTARLVEGGCALEGQRNRDVVVISLGFFLAFVGAGAAQPFVVGYLVEAKGLGEGQASLVLSGVYFSFVVFRFFIGFIIDVIGLHRAKIYGAAAYALFPLIVLKAEAYPVLLLASVLWGLGAPMLWTGSLVQVMNVAGPGRHATSAGIVRGTVTLALFVGAYMLSAIYERYGYESLFVFAALSALTAVIAMLASPRREYPREKPELRTFLRLMGRRESRAVMAFLVAAGLAYGLLLNGFKTHIELSCGVSWLKVILPFFSLAAVTSGFLGGRISDRIGRWRTFMWGFALGGAGMILACGTIHPVGLAVALFLIGVEFAMVPLAAFGWIGDRTTPSDRASVMGYVFCFRDLGIAVAVQLRGAIHGPTTAFWLFGAASAVCAVAAFQIGRSSSGKGTAG
ncbi:MAG TPA: MFS transporter [Candidatus Hydrogenedentes bacterium]|nr:MFS transporter [Candidatus Hydrogenedentota bacterium]